MVTDRRVDRPAVESVDEGSALAMTQSEGHRRASRGSVAGGLRHWSCRGGGRPPERAVHLLEGEALCLGAEHPETDDAEDEPGCEIDKGGTEHDKVRRRRLDDVARTHDYRQPG